MYELRQGSKRLVRALRNMQYDESTINRLANCLNYVPQQLKEDIQALDNYMDSMDREQELVDCLLSNHVAD